ncbi:MAG TPA: nicotinamide-nucleotide amidohydrolase family protein [Aeromicrobium sp.]|nr:nicotinamide-nucleotide amidohydrolase family protein [Aeromicrobium sp.]
MTETPAAAVVAALESRGETVATGESLTGGLVCATLVDVPGASAVVRGAVVGYDPQVKVDLLGVEAALIAEVGTVDPQVAEQLAQGARERLGATWGLGTTGVAGPGPSDGKPAGTVFVAVAGPDGVQSRKLALSGTRSQIRIGAVCEVLSDLQYRLGKNSSSVAVESDKKGDGDDCDA